MWPPTNQNIFFWLAGIILIAGISFSLISGGDLLITGPKGGGGGGKGGGGSTILTDPNSCAGVNGALNTESCQALATEVLKQFTNYDSASCGDASGANANLNDITNDKKPYVCQNSCTSIGDCKPGGNSGTVTVNPLLLRALLDLKNMGYDFKVNSFTGGSHVTKSCHYIGQAMDIDDVIVRNRDTSKRAMTKAKSDAQDWLKSQGFGVIDEGDHIHVGANSTPDIAKVCGTAPKAEAGSLHRLTLGRAHAHQGATTTDAEGDLVSYLWRLVSCPPGVICPPITDAEGSINGEPNEIAPISPPSFTATEHGRDSLRVAGKDATGRIGADSVIENSRYYCASTQDPTYPGGWIYPDVLAPFFYVHSASVGSPHTHVLNLTHDDISNDDNNTHPYRYKWHLLCADLNGNFITCPDNQEFPGSMNDDWSDETFYQTIFLEPNKTQKLSVTYTPAKPGIYYPLLYDGNKCQGPVGWFGQDTAQ